MKKLAFMLGVSASLLGCGSTGDFTPGAQVVPDVPEVRPPAETVVHGSVSR